MSKLLEHDMLYCGACGCFWDDFEEILCPSCHTPTIRKILMREVIKNE